MPSSSFALLGAARGDDDKDVGRVDFFAFPSPAPVLTLLNASSKRPRPPRAVAALIWALSGRRWAAAAVAATMVAAAAAALDARVWLLSNDDTAFLTALPPAPVSVPRAAPAAFSALVFAAALTDAVALSELFGRCALTFFADTLRFSGATAATGAAKDNETDDDCKRISALEGSDSTLRLPLTPFALPPAFSASF